MVLYTPSLADSVKYTQTGRWDSVKYTQTGRCVINAQTGSDGVTYT